MNNTRGSAADFPPLEEYTSYSSLTPVPQDGHLADGRVRSTASSFPNLVQVPVDPGARIPYTGDALFAIPLIAN